MLGSRYEKAGQGTPEVIVARKDPALSARVLRAQPMVYADDPSDETGHHPHVRAASGMTFFREYLAIVQDDANWLALIDQDDVAHALPLPRSPGSGTRIFSGRVGTKGEKYDLEACIVAPGPDGPELIGFGSGSHRGREWILRVREGQPIAAILSERATNDRLEIDLLAEFLDARRFYDALRATRDFAGAGLNIEGAVMIGEDTIRLFQRGNAPAQRAERAVDATADFSWRAFAEHLAAPDTVSPPEPMNIRQYDLGKLDGVRLTFSDAEYLGNRRVLYSASAEHGQTGEIKGSVLGLIEPDGMARWTELTHPDGSRFEGKIEGLSLHRAHPDRIRFVIDDDDEDFPSMLYEAELSDPARK